MTFAIWQIMLLIMSNIRTNDLGRIIKQQRVTIPLTLQELTAQSAVSSSHLGRIERGERFPSAHVLQKIAKPLGFEEGELLTLAGYLSPQSHQIVDEKPRYNSKRVDPYVASVLAQEPVSVQRTVIGLLTMLKSIAKNIPREAL